MGFETIGDNLHEMSNNVLWENKKKKNSKMSCTEFITSMLSVNQESAVAVACYASTSL